ncbi:MAG: hypothetical protein A2Z02_06330 [Chloroflexi bacterium RBG_16_48_7]|nr:MAG: hypothetical protein A2Z02_06330 [Chloroflexi bacterium RBG_16_48_7]
MSDRNNSSSIIWLLVGAAIGASIALLYAPQSGEETRHLLKEKEAKAREKVSQTFGKIKESMGPGTEKQES